MQLKETVRKDGLRVITISIPNQRKIFVEVACRVGSAYDPADKRGLFHFFEHMAFKGTKRRSLDDIQSFTQRNLLGMNAVTHHLSTRYYTFAVYTKLKEVCDFLCDIYCNSTFPAKELEKERRPVLLEIARNEDEDSFVADEALRQQLWKNNPIRFSGGGSVDGVKVVQRADMMRERDRWHVPAATVAIAIGKVDHQSFVREIYKNIPLSSKKVQPSTWSDEYSELPKKHRIVIKRPKRQKAIVMLGFKVPFHLPEKTVDCLFLCMEQLLSRGSGSQLYKEIREKRGLAYAVDGGFQTLPGLGRYYAAYVETAPEHVEEVEQLILKVLQAPLMSHRDFEEVRERMLDRATLDFDNNFGEYEDTIWDNISGNLAIQRTIRYYSNMRKALLSASLEEVEAARKEFFKPEAFVTVIVTPK